jgi:O-antigen ligase
LERATRFPVDTPSSSGTGTFGLRGAWILPLFVLVGLMLSWILASLVNRHGALLVLALLLLGPPAVILLAIVVRGGVAKLRALKAHLAWPHLLWLLVLCSGFVFRLRDATDVARQAVDSAATFRIALVGITAAVLIVRLGLRRPPWLASLFRGLLAPLAVFGLICLTSTLWSIYPAWTIYKSLEFLVEAALLAAVLGTLRSVEDFKTFWDWTWTLYGLLLFSVWIGAVLWPKEALEASYQVGILGYRLMGVVPGQGANRVGDLGALVGVIAFSRLVSADRQKSDRVWYAALLLVCLVTMVFSQTRSAIAGFLLGSLLILLFTRRVALGAILSVVGGLLVTAGSVGGLIWAFLLRGDTQADISSFSGRLRMWSFAWQKLMEHPWTGLGAYAGGPFAVLSELKGRVGPLHSDYVEILVGTSFWGLIPILIALFGTWWLLIRYVRRFSSMPLQRQLALEALAVLAVLSLRSVFMTLLVLHPPLHFLAVLGYAEFLRRRQQDGPGAVALQSG